MAVADFSTYLSKVAAPTQTVPVGKLQLGASVGHVMSLLTAGPLGGAAPGAAAVPARTLTGAIQQLDGSGTQYIAQALLGGSQFSGTLMIYDRLSHQSGLDATVITAQTTNLPTAALTRYTGGVGVMAALEVYTQIGSTSTTVTISYTNQTGTTGFTSPATLFGATSNREVARMMVLPLAAGDTGVQAVASVTVLATTGTAGNFGVTLFKPLLLIPLASASTAQVWDALLNGCASMEPVQSGACLCFALINSDIATAAGSTQTFPFSGTLSFIEA